MRPQASQLQGLQSNLEQQLQAWRKDLEARRGDSRPAGPQLPCAGGKEVLDGLIAAGKELELRRSQQPAPQPLQPRVHAFPPAEHDRKGLTAASSSTGRPADDYSSSGPSLPQLATPGGLGTPPSNLLPSHSGGAASLQPPPHSDPLPERRGAERRGDLQAPPRAAGEPHGLTEPPCSSDFGPARARPWRPEAPAQPSAPPDLSHLGSPVGPHSLQRLPKAAAATDRGNAGDFLAVAPATSNLVEHPNHDHDVVAGALQETELSPVPQPSSPEQLSARAMLHALYAASAQGREAAPAVSSLRRHSQDTGSEASCDGTSEVEVEVEEGDEEGTDMLEATSEDREELEQLRAELRQESARIAELEVRLQRARALNAEAKSGSRSWAASASEASSDASTAASSSRASTSEVQHWQERAQALERDLRSEAATALDVQDRIHWLRAQLTRQPARQDERFLAIRQLLARLADHAEAVSAGNCRGPCVPPQGLSVWTSGRGTLLPMPQEAWSG